MSRNLPQFLTEIAEEVTKLINPVPRSPRPLQRWESMVREWSIKERRELSAQREWDQQYTKAPVVDRTGKITEWWSDPDAPDRPEAPLVTPLCDAVAHESVDGAPLDGALAAKYAVLGAIHHALDGVPHIDPWREDESAPKIEVWPRCPGEEESVEVLDTPMNFFVLEKTVTDYVRENENAEVRLTSYLQQVLADLNAHVGGDQQDTYELPWSWSDFWSRFLDSDTLKISDNVTLQDATHEDLRNMIFYWECFPCFFSEPDYESEAAVDQSPVDGLAAQGDEAAALGALRAFWCSQAAAAFIAHAAKIRGLDDLQFGAAHAIFRHYITEAVKLRPIDPSDPRTAWAAPDFLGVFPTGEGPREHERHDFEAGLSVLSKLKAALEMGQGGVAEVVRDPDARLGGGQKVTMQQPWADDAPEYLPLTEARKLIDNRIALPALSKLCKPDGKMRYMRKPGFGCKVHIADFRQYMRGRQSDPDWAAAYMNWLQGQKAGKTRVFWKCLDPACGHEYPEDSNATDRCPKCKEEAELTPRPPPKPSQ